MLDHEFRVWFAAFLFCWRAVGVLVAAAPAADYLHFRRLTPAEGLPTEQVLRIFEDSRGFLWFGTSDGLARYDSHEFRVFRPDPKDPHSLGNGNVSDIREDAQGNLWIATQGGLDCWRRDTEQFAHFRHETNNPASLSSDKTWCLWLDPDGSLWVGTSGAGLNHFDPRSGKCERFGGPPDGRADLKDATIECLFRDRQGVLWVGTVEDGLNQFDPKTGRFRAYAHDPADPRSLSHNHVSAIVEDAQGYLWVGTYDGVSRLDPARRFFERLRADVDDPGALPSRTVAALLVDREGQVWVGTDGGGLSRFNLATRKFIHYRHSQFAQWTLASDVVRTLLQDRSGDLWIGHFPAGASHADRLTAPFRTFRAVPGETNTLSDEHVLSFLDDPAGGLWVGTDKGGLNHWHETTGRWTHYRHDSHDARSLGAKAVLALLHDYRGRLWVGTWGGGLNLLEPDTGTFRRYLPEPNRGNALGSDVVTSLVEDQRRQLWAGTWGEGVYRYVPEEDGFVRYHHDPADPRSLNSDHISSLLVTRNGTLWVGTTEGLARWVPATRSWDRFQHQPGKPGTLSHSEVIDLLEDRQGAIWVSTGGGGLNRLDPQTGTGENFRTAGGLPSDLLRGIVEDADGMLWISSNQGLARFDPRTSRIRVFDEHDGLPGRQFSSNGRLRLRSGELVFGTTQGFVRFDPRALQPNTNPPPVVLTGFEVFNQPMRPGLPDSPLRQSISETRRLELPARLSVLSFQFAALNYRSSVRNQYRFMLEGFDQGWRKPGPERRATYTNLDPGRYRLRVQAANGDGMWNLTGVNLELVIVPAWWQTWWSRGAAGLGLLAGAVMTGWRVAGHRSRDRLREAEIERQAAQEREQAEKALRQSEERFRLIMESSTDLVAVLDLEGRRLYNSPSYRNILGDPTGLRGSLSFEEIHPEDRARVRLSFQETVRTGAGQRLEYRLVDHLGQVRHIESQGSVMRDEHGRVAKVLVVSRDVTERQRAEEALRQSEQKYRELVEHANSIILRWTRDGRITFLNEFGQRFLGYTQDEIRGRHVFDTLVPETESGGRQLPSLIDQICANPAAFEQNVNQNVRRNGERVWICWTNKVVLDPQGQVAEILSIGLDITARKRIEEELRETQANLERRVADRTAELAAAKDRAEAADRLKSSFLATMSHELRTPLNSIIGFTGILIQGLAGPLNPEQRKQLEMVRGSARHLLALINDVLDISKIEAGQLEVAREPVDLRASVEKVAALVKPLADKKGLALRVELAPEIGTVQSDQRRVEQVLLNLLNNALKFTERGEITLSAQTVPGTAGDPHATIRLSVADTGVGIKPEDLATLFQPFRQIDSGLARYHEGTGLGLAICRRLAELMGGKVHARSEWGKGSTFSFTLPSGT